MTQSVRRCRLESLDPRIAFSADALPMLEATAEVAEAPHPWQNPTQPWDVNQDTRLTLDDVLPIVVALRDQGGAYLLPQPSGEPGAGPPPFLDVDGDDWATLGDLLATLQEMRDRGQVVYFVVAELPGQETHFDSYVLPLSDPAAIAHARELISQGPEIGETIVVAGIAAGADGVNRDYRAAGAPPWSWQVTEFHGFADFTTEVCDGWPTFVEEDVEGWIANTNATVCFWSYTVVAELGTA